MSFVSHIECTVCGRRHVRGERLTVCSACGQMLAVRYDLPRVQAGVTKAGLRERPPGMYRFNELLPIEDGEHLVTLGEGGTPLLPLPRLAAHLGLVRLWAKDEGQNPTGTFKARGLGMAVTRARALGATGFVIPSAGNAGGAAAVYGARAGLPVVVIVPRGTPPAAVAEAALAGAHVFSVEGSIADAGKIAGALAQQLGPSGWCDLSTLKEPYRLEGKKTMGLELAEQLDWTAPDLLVYPTGGGTGLVGIQKAYAELDAIGWISGAPRCPRFFAVQAEGCAPVVRAFESGESMTRAWERPVTHAAGLRVPSPFAGRQILQAIRERQGGAIAVSEVEIVEAQRLLARLEGLWVSPEAASTVASLLRLRDRRALDRYERVVLISTGSGLKNDPPVIPEPVDLTGDVAASVAEIRAHIGRTDQSRSLG